MTNFTQLKLTRSKRIRYLKLSQKNTSYIVFLHGFMSNLEGKKPKTFLDFAKKKCKTDVGFLKIYFRFLFQTLRIGATLRVTSIYAS